MQLTQHFSLEEMYFSETAARNKIDNKPPASLRPTLVRTAEGLERVRVACGGRPIFITSGYRNPTVNKLVGGVSTSQHAKGEAADIRVAGLTPRQVAQIIRAQAKEVAYDQLILEYPDAANGWVHVSFGPRNRRDVLTKLPSGYVQGIV